MYYPINETAARQANDANSFKDYHDGSATAEYRNMVNKATKMAEQQKARVDAMYHGKIDYLLDIYSRRLADNFNKRYMIEARVPSWMISGPANFPVTKKEKQNAARDHNMQEYREIQEILKKIQSTGTGGISSDDPDAVQKLRAQLLELQESQERMKRINTYYRKHKTLTGCPELSEQQIERIQASMTAGQQYGQGRIPFEAYMLTNNNSNIRRIQGRIEELEARKQAPEPDGWEFDGGRVELNQELNRIQLFYDSKPDEETRGLLKGNGFRWAPSQGAWQRMLNENGIYSAKKVTSRA